MYIYRMIRFSVGSNPQVVVHPPEGIVVKDLNEFCNDDQVEFISFTKTPQDDSIHNSSFAVGIFKRKENFSSSKELNNILWKV